MSNTQACKPVISPSFKSRLTNLLFALIVFISIGVFLTSCSNNQNHAGGNPSAISEDTEPSKLPTDEKIDLFAGPGHDYVKLGAINPSDIDSIVKVEGDWAEIERGDRRGYVSTNNLDNEKVKIAPHVVTKPSQNMYPYPTVYCFAQQISLFDEATVYLSPKGTSTRLGLEAGSDVTILTIEENGLFRYAQIEFDAEDGKRRGYSTVTDLMSLDNPLINFDSVKASNMPIGYSGTTYWSTSGEAMSSDWRSVNELRLSQTDFDIWKGLSNVIASNDVNDEALDSTRGKVQLYSAKDRQYINANTEDAKASRAANLIDIVFSGVASFAEGAVENSVLHVSLEECRGEHRIVIKSGVPFESQYAGKKMRLSELIAKEGGALDIVESGKREDQIIKEMYPDLDLSKTYSMQMTFSKDFKENGYGYYIVIDKSGVVRKVPIIHPGTSFKVYSGKDLICDATHDLASTMIDVDTESTQTVLKMLSDAGFELSDVAENSAIGGKMENRNAPQIVGEAVDEPIYTLRYNLCGLQREGGSGNIGSGVYVPGTISEYRTYYGDQGSVQKVGNAYTTHRATIPDTELSIEYMFGDSDEDQAEAWGISGPLREIVDGLPDGQAIGVQDFASSLQTQEGIFDAGSLVPSHILPSLEKCGSSYVQSPIPPSGRADIYYADGSESMVRVIVVDLDENGMISWDSMATLTTYAGIYQ